MDQIQHFIQRFFPPAQPLAPGIYHYQAPADAANPLRLHLRIDPDGEGVLIVNASTVLRLNQTAVELAYHLVQQTPELEIGKQMSARYHIAANVAIKDFSEFKQRLETLIQTPDLDPVGFLGFDRAAPYTSAVLAPYRLDCALTYRLTTPRSQELAPVERVKRELLSEEWEMIMKKAWDAGVPHVILTGGEPTLRPDLPELIAFTEKVGMVCGLLTDGLRLTDRHYLRQILEAGLDHVMLLLDPALEPSWEALRDLIDVDISTTVHLTVTAKNADTIPALFDRLVKMRVKQISLSTDDPGMKDKLVTLRHLSAEKGLTLIWDLPVPYSRFHPVALELAEGEETQGAGRAWLYVEPDGDVLPAQGINQVMGNLLTDPWEAIWAHHA
jgi:hypothetical protein